jgi:hypothetical protein
MLLSIKAKRIRNPDRVAITFEVEAAAWRNMARAAEADAHPDTVDYVAARINAAFVEDWPVAGAAAERTEE